MAVALVGAIVAVFVGWTGIGDWRPFCDGLGWCVISSAKSGDSTNNPSVQPSPDRSSPAAAAPSPSISPTPVSEGPTEYLAQGTLTLAEASSSQIDEWGLRVSTGYVFDTFARIGASTDSGPCDAMLDVGDSMVLSNRLSGETDYSEWYVVVLSSTLNDEATLDWSVGSGAAPVTAFSNSCV